MTIALVILHADPAKGGAERYTFDLAEALARAGHAVTLVASTFGPRPAGVACVELGERGLTRLGRYHRFLDDLDRHLDAHPYDVVHAMLPVRRCDVYHPHAGVAAEAVATGHLKHTRPLQRTLAHVANRINIKRQAFARVERDLLLHPLPVPRERAGVRAGPSTTQASDSPTTPVILCLSDYIKSTVRQHYPLPDDRLATLFNAVDLAKFDPAATPAAGREVRERFNLTDKPVGLIIAQDFERKGLAEAIEALARVDQPPALVVVGKQDPADYRDLAKKLGVAQHVHFAGPTTDPYAFYAAADFFILPTRHDPCSLVVLEALAMGLPVISTKQNGACEIMTPGVHGFVLDSADDQPALVAAVRTMLDPAARGRMRAACLALRPRLAYERHLDTLLSIYQQTARVPAQMALPAPISPPVPPPL